MFFVLINEMRNNLSKTDFVFPFGVIKANCNISSLHATLIIHLVCQTGWTTVFEKSHTQSKMLHYYSDSDYGGETDVSLNCGRFYGGYSSPEENEWGMGEWTNERTIFFNFRKCGAQVEWYWRENLRTWEKPAQCHFDHHISYWIEPGTNPGHRSDRLLHY
jgi:hypothetical protein